MASHAHAGIFRPHVTNDLEVPRHVIQHLGDVLAQLGHAATAVGAGAGAIVGRLMHDLLARQMIGQRLALRLVGACAGRCRRIRRFGAGGIFGRTGLQFLELELELLDLAADPLRRAAELHAPQLGDLEPQLLDLQRLQLNRGLRRLQLALAGQRERAQCGGIDQAVRPWRATCLNLSRTRTAQPESKRNRCSVTPTLVAATAAVLSCAANPSPRPAPKTAPA